jgi:hypothetical protein
LGDRPTITGMTKPGMASVMAVDGSNKVLIDVLTLFLFLLKSIIIYRAVGAHSHTSHSLIFE